MSGDTDEYNDDDYMNGFDCGQADKHNKTKRNLHLFLADKSDFWCDGYYDGLENG